MMYLLTEPDGARPTFVDDRNFYRPAGVKKWVRNGFPNENIKVPLGVIAILRTQIEADLLVQNLMLLAEAMGLGTWIHASISSEVLLGDPKFRDQYGPMLGFELVTPTFKLLDVLRWQVPLPKYADLRSHPVAPKFGDEYLIKAMCPPYYPSMTDAVAEVIRLKFGPDGVYNNTGTFAKILKGDYGARFLKEAQPYNEHLIDCVRDVCAYTYRTHRDFQLMLTRSTCRASGFRCIIQTSCITTACSSTD